MKCKQCGTEFTGNYCPECGVKNEGEYQKKMDQAWSE